MKHNGFVLFILVLFTILMMVGFKYQLEKSSKTDQAFFSYDHIV